MKITSATGVFETTVLKKYAEVVQRTSAKTDTQLGLMADYVTYK